MPRAFCASHLPRRRGFTLIELMVVASVIVCLLVVTVPALKSMINSGQQAQAANVIRSMLLVVRDYALTNSVVTGVRFQDDGRIVPIYARNAGQHDTANYRTSGGGALPGQAGNPFQMYTIPGMAPGMMPGAYRVIALDYTYNAYNASSANVGMAGWMLGTGQSAPYGQGTAGANWFVGQQWCLSSVILFSSRGKCIQAQVQFPANWAPTTAGSYGKWLAPTTYSYQGATSADCIAHTYTMSDWGVEMTGPSVSTDFRIYDYGAAQVYLSQASQNPTPSGSYTFYAPNESLTEAYRLIEQTGSDFIIDSNTGRMIRKGADLAVEQ